MRVEVEIGLRLKEFAKDKFGSIPKLADKLGMSGHNLRQYARGDAVLGGLYLRKLCELGCDINWLLTGKGQEPIDIDGIKEELLQQFVKSLNDKP